MSVHTVLDAHRRYGSTETTLWELLREAEWENGSWRHRVETPKMVFVVAFDPEPDRMPADDQDLGDMEVVLVTGWRMKP